jgi:hypothetical protein
MKTLIKLAIAALLIHATWRSGMVFWRYYQFQDEVQRVAQFAGSRSEGDLQHVVMDVAGRLQVPLTEDHVTIRREPNHLLINATYTDRIEIVPTYFYPWEFKMQADALTFTGPH